MLFLYVYILCLTVSNHTKFFFCIWFSAGPIIRYYFVFWQTAMPKTACENIRCNYNSFWGYPLVACKVRTVEMTSSLKKILVSSLGSIWSTHEYVIMKKSLWQCFCSFSLLRWYAFDRIVKTMRLTLCIFNFIGVEIRWKFFFFISNPDPSPLLKRYTKSSPHELLALSFMVHFLKQIVSHNCMFWIF